MDDELAANRLIRVAALFTGLLAGLLIYPIAVFSFSLAVRCSEGCWRPLEGAIFVLFTSPLLLLIAAIAGVVSFKHPERGTLYLTFVPATIVGLAAAFSAWLT